MYAPHVQQREVHSFSRLQCCAMLQDHQGLHVQQVDMLHMLGNVAAVRHSRTVEYTWSVLWVMSCTPSLPL